VLDLRESAMRLGLLRKYRGRLLATPRGRRLRGDPGGLWWHLAGQMPPPKSARHETHSGLLLLAAVAAGPQTVPDPFGYLTQMLYRLGALTPDRPGSAPDQPTLDGALFARAALRTWPA
jgi:hypothetical protein